MCRQWFFAEDGQGDYPPFACWFLMSRWDGSEYVPGWSHLIYEDGRDFGLDTGVMYKAECFFYPDPQPDWELPAAVEFVACSDEPITFVYVFVGEPPALAFADVAISRRYGERLYLSGTIDEISESDEICVYFSRPGDTGIRNLKSDTSDYLYFKGASGSYDLGANNRYIEFERAGYHWLQIWDVVGNCETPILKRAEWLMNIVLPRYQYQLIFDLEDDDLGDNLYLLEAEYAKYEAAGSWFINHDDPDCFERIQPINTPEDDTPQSGWLSLGVEFGESPCAPIPYYLCPLPTPQTQYWRGECSCDLFKNTLQPLGIPCSHLIAAMKWYSGEPAWSKYIQCP